MPTRLIAAGLAVAFTGAFSACAGPGETADPELAQQAERCHFDETWSCVERMGQAERCFCADKDTLRELLEPTIR